MPNKKNREIEDLTALAQVMSLFIDVHETQTAWGVETTISYNDSPISPFAMLSKEQAQLLYDLTHDDESVYSRACPDCQVEPGRPHRSGCDVARCLQTGHQRFSCSGEDEHKGDCGLDVWDGQWPGDRDAARLGFWTRWVDRATGEPISFSAGRPGRWQSCGALDDGAEPDINRLRPPYAQWNITSRRWETFEEETLEKAEEVE